jgi:hypothetical protein
MSIDYEDGRKHAQQECAAEIATLRSRISTQADIIEVWSPLIDKLEASIADLERVLEHTVLGRDKAMANAASLERELERWRHGVTVEGDYVCPDSLRMTELGAALRRMVDEADDLVRGYGIAELRAEPGSSLEQARAALRAGEAK